MFKEILTNPASHNPEAFVYIVHGLWRPPSIYDPSSQVKALQAVQKVKSPDDFLSTSLVGKLDAEAAKRKLGWSGGALSHTYTQGVVGLIVEPPSDGQIYVAWNCDLSSHRPSYDDLKAFVMKNKGKIRSPLTLLAHTESILGMCWNELILRGDPNTRVGGVFYVAQNEEIEGSGKLLAEIVSGVERKEVPVIVLPPQPDPAKTAFPTTGQQVIFPPPAFSEFYATPPAASLAHLLH